MYYDKDGLPIDSSAWGRLTTDQNYKRVARTRVMSGADPDKVFDVSTVWLGLDHSFGEGLPVIFETMVFAEGDAMDLDCRRYHSLEAAQAGHLETVVTISATLEDAIVMDAEE